MSFGPVYSRFKKDSYYVQCTLRKPEASLVTVSWVEKGIAAKGKEITVNGDSGWVIEEVYKNILIKGKFLETLSNQYNYTRVESDI